MAHELGHPLVPLEEWRATILSHLGPLEPQALGLLDSLGRVLAEEVRSEIFVPPFDNSAMDGFAVRCADVCAASEEAPATLVVSRAHAAGDPGDAPLEPGTAARIMTGAPLPQGAEAVIPHELTRFDDKTVTFTRPAQPGANIRRRGGDVAPGDVALASGLVLGGPQLGVAASLGVTTLRVTRRPRVAIISPGDELVDVATTPGPGQIRNSNAFSLAGLLLSNGCEPILRGIVPDSLEAIRAAIGQALDEGADAIVTTGGVSAGDYDFVQKVVREDGRPGHVAKVAMRPGKPQVFGLFRGKPLFGLPGNPAAAVVSFEVFVRPALRALLGQRPMVPERFAVRFPSVHAYRPGRVFLLRARVEADPVHGHEVASIGQQDSAVLSSLAEANAIIFLEAERGRVEAGETAPALWLTGANP